MVPTIDRAIAEDPKLRVVFKVIPILGAPSVIEARAILAAGKQGRYVAAMQEALMRDQAPPTDAEVTRIARSVGVDPVRLARDADAPDVTKQIADNIALARALHADGTPTLVIGSQVIPGALDADSGVDAFLMRLSTTRERNLRPLSLISQPHPLRNMVRALLHREIGAVQVLSNENGRPRAAPFRSESVPARQAGDPLPATNCAR